MSELKRPPSTPAELAASKQRAWRMLRSVRVPKRFPHDAPVRDAIIALVARGCRPLADRVRLD